MLLRASEEICKTEKAGGFSSRSMTIPFACVHLADGLFSCNDWVHMAFRNIHDHTLTRVAVRLGPPA